MKYSVSKTYLLIAGFLLINLHTMAQPVRVAVAANAQFVLNKLKDSFEKKTGITVEVISGSSGKLATQIKNGAPYDIFLSADMQFAETVYTGGLALGKPRVYASGSLIICSATGADVTQWKTLVAAEKTGKIAIANPELAPYGKAAMEALRYFRLDQKTASRLVFGESISQVNTYVLKRVVALGFTTESLVYEIPNTTAFKWQRIDPSAYAPILQGAVLLKHAKSKNYQHNKRFFDYIFSKEAKAIFRKYGYSFKSTD